MISSEQSNYNMNIDKEKHLTELRAKFDSYSIIEEKTWHHIQSVISFQSIRKGEILVSAGQIAKYIHFVCKGALRAFITDHQGNSYNKNIFLEGDLSASTVSLLLRTPSHFTIEALEDSLVIALDFQIYKQMIDTHVDLKNFYIAYIERHWIVEKEKKEVSLVMENAKERYLKLLETHACIDSRIPQHHIASHLGITPTQLSRIRKELKR